ncbi:S-DNA-T family DNA segregation ATPase FtsK/SpoIIIE [Krasilnikovia cinnamomea]|uniref:S-DNA-T family DNA segregation ATPase FtsK/SpoIIIE n=1 Tax=Krasilnikovia cinnamomea TaxID=349313 RepID=A0A4Q7ZNC6_9ACTN|nr:FtsK/SpoIIIE domain-containing protein [Krasilnikovia cinnamomea]RZU52527.1 S-DNA-T family DNA segregation ATPase FtsK/SpoIIIE [Krasilnikovia cinnamomea]
MRAPLVNFRKMQVATPWWMIWAVVLFWLVVKLLVVAARLAWFAAKHWRAMPAVVLALVALRVYLDHGWWPLLVAAALAGGVLGLWCWKAREFFDRWVLLPALAIWRRQWIYRRHWHETMTACGLVRRYDGGELLPRLLSVKCTNATDEVVLKMPRGQNPDDWYKANSDLAYSFEHRHCRVYSTRRAVAPARTGRCSRLRRAVDRFTYRDRPRHITLVFIRRDALTQLVQPFPVPSVPDFTALVLGVRENLMPYALRLLATHVLVVGATRRGKGSFIWSLVRSLAAGVKAGLVELWVIDPKGGMELFMGRPMFSRYEDSDFAQMADMLDDLIARMRERQARLRGKVRVHSPRIGDPLTVLIIDELACLLAYLQDNELKNRITQSLAVLLSQGAGLGVLVVGASQDPRKEVVSLRDLFPTRIGLGLLESNHVDLVLGEGARNRGALCDQIPDTAEGKGVGYVLIDGEPEPARVRFSYIDDDLIREMADLFPAVTPAITAPEPVRIVPAPKQVDAGRRQHLYRPNGKQAGPLLPSNLLSALDQNPPTTGGDSA